MCNMYSVKLRAHLRAKAFDIFATLSDDSSGTLCAHQETKLKLSVGQSISVTVAL